MKIVDPHIWYPFSKLYTSTKNGTGSHTSWCWNWMWRDRWPSFSLKVARKSRMETNWLLNASESRTNSSCNVLEPIEREPGHPILMPPALGNLTKHGSRNFTTQRSSQVPYTAKMIKEDNVSQSSLLKAWFGYWTSPKTYSHLWEQRFLIFVSLPLWALTEFPKSSGIKIHFQWLWLTPNRTCRSEQIQGPNQTHEPWPSCKHQAPMKGPWRFRFKSWLLHYVAEECQTSLSGPVVPALLSKRWE